MMLLKSKKYPFGRFQILPLVGNHFNFKKKCWFLETPMLCTWILCKMDFTTYVYGN